MKRFCLNLFLPATLLTLATPALAEGEDVAAEPNAAEDDTRAGRKMDLREPEPTTPAPRKAYVHEGFYFRGGVGPGFMHTSISDQQSDSSAGSPAFSIAADLMIGGSPAPGLALGLGAMGQIGMASKFDGTGSGVFHLNVGPFFDAFPDSKKGFHLGAQLGGSTATLSSAVSPSSPLWGGGGAAWLGWDTWVAPEWSVGIQLQTGGAYVAAPQVGVSIFHANLLLTLLQH